MSNIVSTNLKGGLGNQLFQIFNVIAYSFRYNKQFLFTYSDTLKIGIERPTYWNNLLEPLKQFTTTSSNKFKIYKEPHFHYKEISYIRGNVLFDGYYQSHLYFEDYISKIKDIIKFKSLQNEIREKYIQYTIDNNIISLHFRIGDYITKQDCHPILNIDYYIKCLHSIIKKTNINNWKILCFFEKTDVEIAIKQIEELKKNFINCIFVNINHDISDWEQMLLMTCCEHNIIANSTFSWWGAYLNENNNKIVCYPTIWFGSMLKKYNTHNLYPDNWIPIN